MFKQRETKHTTVAKKSGSSYRNRSARPLAFANELKERTRLYLVSEMKRVVSDRLEPTMLLFPGKETAKIFPGGCALGSEHESAAPAADRSVIRR